MHLLPPCCLAEGEWAGIETRVRIDKNFTKDFWSASFKPRFELIHRSKIHEFTAIEKQNVVRYILDLDMRELASRLCEMTNPSRSLNYCLMIKVVQFSKQGRSLFKIAQSSKSREFLYLRPSGRLVHKSKPEARSSLKNASQHTTLASAASAAIELVNFSGPA